MTEGIELHQALIEKLAGTPTPRQLEVGQQQKDEVIPLDSVQRMNQKK